MFKVTSQFCGLTIALLRDRINNGLVTETLFKGRKFYEAGTEERKTLIAIAPWGVVRAGTSSVGIA